MRILLFGANGQVGTELRAIDWGEDTELVALGRQQSDLLVSGNAGRVIDKEQSDLVINASAYTAVDKAESEPDLALAINARAPGEMADACSKQGIPLIHISTDYVFDGSKQGPYVEDDPVVPLGAYGRSKETGERAVREALGSHIILRTSWVFSAHGQNFVKTMLRLGAERDELGIIDDQRGCPTAAAHIAQVIAAITRQILEGKCIPWGTYHYCGTGETTWFGFACAIFEAAGSYIESPPNV
ncbi:MAG TPA: dTDP-4-dehydrorhamnose reductase, partial [Rhodospirillales bacterium]|nr:dTDP-4-dehydrorhamnose reductase [Rhodospirillales bacterium]